MTNSDGTKTETLTYQSYNGRVNGSFSAVSETGTRTDLASAYQSLLSAMKANGEMDDTAASQLKEAFSRMEDSRRESQ